MKWVRHWLDTGSRAVEEVLARDRADRDFCVGDQPTVADICLAAHLTSAKLFGGRDPADYPVAGRIYANCMAIEAFAAEHPLRQPDAPEGMTPITARLPRVRGRELALGRHGSFSRCAFSSFWSAAARALRSGSPSGRWSMSSAGRAASSGSRSALYMLVSAVATFIAGRMADRLSPRALLIAGTVLGGVGIALMSLVSQPWHALVLYGVVFAIGNGAASLVIVGVIVMRALSGPRRASPMRSRSPA